MATESSPVLAGPIGDCCVQGVKHTGEASGKSIEIDGVPTYLSEPLTPQPGGKKVVLFFPDVYGPFYLNNQLLQDYFASQGFYALGIDFFFGDPVHIHTEPDFDRQAWRVKSKKQAANAVPGWVDAVQALYGYCFGAPYALELGGTDKVVAAAFAHPSGLSEDHFKQLKAPTIISAAEDDRAFPAESRRRAVDILIEKQATFHVQLFSGVSHGFGTRADPEVENSRWAKEESARGIINWFARFSK